MLSRASSEVGRAASPRPFNARIALGSLVAFGAYGVGLSALYALTGLGLPCPFRALTGWDCPLCGGTRLGSSLLHLDVVTAFRYNPAVLIGLLIVAVLGVLWTVESLGGPKVRPPVAVTQRLNRIRPTQWTFVFVVLAIGYTLLRHLL